MWKASLQRYRRIESVEYPEHELPGDVLVAIRESEGYVRSVRTFAELIGLSYDTWRRLELVKWGTLPEEWVRPVDRSDLDALISAGLLQEGDAYWERLNKAFAWQHLVRKLGERIYRDLSLGAEQSEPLLTTVPSRHVRALAQTVVMREVRRYQSEGLEGEPVEVLVEKITADVVATMTLAALASEDAPDTCDEDDLERTRSIPGEPTGQGQAETPYVRTLRIAYELAEQAAREMLGSP